MKSSHRAQSRIPADIAATCRNLAVQFTTATQVPISPGKVLALAARRGLTTLTPADFTTSTTGPTAA